MKCYDTYPCSLFYARFDNGSMKVETYIKSCAHQRACEQINKGNITLDEAGCYPSSICKGKCCYEDECNKGNILADTSEHNSGNALAISGSVVGLFFGLSLSLLVSILVVNKVLRW